MLPWPLRLQAGVTLAAIFVHWLIWVSLYRIGALCPYCMAVWAVAIPLFVIVTQRNLRLLPGQTGSRRACTGTWSKESPVEWWGLRVSGEAA